MSRSLGLSVVALASLVALGASQAAAAPQAIGLIARADPVTLQCERGECGVELTAFCVERYRGSPEPDTAYYLHDLDSVAIEGVRRDGTTIDLDIAELFTVTTERGHSAVRMSIPASVLERFDVASLRMSVSRTATLIPVAVPGDPNPMTDVDILLASGPLRTAAAVIVDNGGERIDAARITASVINRLPRHGRASEAQRDGAWQAGARSAGASGHDLARKGFDRCHAMTRSGMQSLRQCLGSIHDSFVGELNTSYWQALEIGS